MENLSGRPPKSKLGKFLAKSNRGKYASVAKILLQRFHVPAVPMRLSYGAWWLARSGMLDERLIAGEFEGSEIRFVQRFLKPGMTVLDIGAHHGLYSLLAARCVGPMGRVMSFEPSPRERKYLIRNLKMNFCRNVQVESCALGSKAGHSELFLVNGAENGCNSLRPPAGMLATKKISVAVSSVDEYLRLKGIEKVDFIKLDVEGAELEVLRGASQLLQGSNRPVILAEVEDVRTGPWGYRAEEIIRHLEGKDFQWFGVCDSGSLVTLDTGVNNYDGNYVAWPKERLPEAATLAT
jgi:FkbM family methyltransferase